MRDVTATIESLPLICASIMSKKMAEGIQGLVLDVKWGSGAFMKTREQATELARRLCGIGATGGKKVVAFVTDMNQPLGRFIGNSLEIEECVAILRREGLRGRTLEELRDCEELSVQLAGTMIWLGGKAATPEAGVTRARELLNSGAAFAKFEELVKLQGGRLSELPKATVSAEVLAPADGRVVAFETEQIGYAALVMGAGRRKTGDNLDLTAGIESLVRLGDRVKKGKVLYRLYGTSAIAEATERLLGATKIDTSGGADKSLPFGGADDLIAVRIGID